MIILERFLMYFMIILDRILTYFMTDILGFALMGFINFFYHGQGIVSIINSSEQHQKNKFNGYNFQP
jgi:hypothetical protein